MEGQKHQWGVTKPILEAQPTEADLKLNDQLIEALKRENNFETPEGTDVRQRVLDHLQKVVEEFIRRAGKAKGLPASTVDSSGGKIFWFGSYALGVYGPSSDIDTLIVAPKHIYLDDFFEHFPPTFREMSNESDITEFVPVKDTFVPIIKMEYRGVSIDLLFASLPSKSSIPKDFDLTEKGILRGLDDTAMRSVNGTRVCAELLQAVPQVKSFRHALRAVKLWSNQRGIYGAVFGFPGGVAWAIMVARICQLYPFACGATILSKFFGLMLKWNWPAPIILKSIEEGTMNLRVWNPAIYPQDRAHLMPIITPAFPSMCATHTIMHSTKGIMMDEFARADAILGSIITGKKTWADLFERHSFFTKDHKYYLSVIAASRTKEAHDLFAGLVQSKTRLLVKGIDDGDAGVDRARPYPKGVDRVHICDTEDQIERIIQGNMEFQVPEGQSVDDLVKGADERHIIYTTTFYIGLTLPEGGTRSLDISFPVSEFKRFITMSDTYNEDVMSVRVVHTRNHQLPDDLFKPGEKKPEKEKKRKKASGKPKRSFAETGLDDSQIASAKRRESENVNGLPTPTPV
ncbi:Poly(A) polymerase [Aaosphaeria arxii CBS 175.79]|uniref:Poly(A) polymerase n=1 Tax=Aaosphaeria arxii CBS 175.79 TaxID=1450172 RepID=A0A6A5XE45_9PLEO|nr:Poly(A) polymerase [Aaosphaeria arxii CBS 175.79]KAF2011170.1 Poly(A) polymerase [Aaosphaeria arxii CBS 175.79]